MLSQEKRANVLSKLLMGGKEAPSVGKGALIGGGVGGLAGALRFAKGEATNVHPVEKALIDTVGAPFAIAGIYGGAIPADGLRKLLGAERKFKNYVDDAVRIGGTTSGATFGAGIGAATNAIRKAKYMKELKKRKLIAALVGTGAVGAGTAAALHNK